MKRGPGGAAVLAALLAGVVVCAGVREAAAAPNRAAAKKEKQKGQLLTLFSEAAGEREVEVPDLRFAAFETRYRHTAAPKSESPTGERIEVVQKRKECSCVRLADWSKVKMVRIRQIDLTYPEGGRVALVRITRRDGDVREYPATSLYGGDGLFPPRFSATVDGAHLEFPLVLPDTPGAAWPEERVVRMILYRPDTPPAPKKKKDASAPR
jgi:hypothetical protein